MNNTKYSEVVLPRNGIENLRKVVDGGYCTGCGACAYASNTTMTINEYGEYLPNLSDIEKSPSIAGIDATCPMLKPELDENELASLFFGNDLQPNEFIGSHYQSFAGFVTEKRFRKNGTSGGCGSWIGAELLRLGLIDGVIHVKSIERENEKSPFFKYAISRTESEISAGSKTKYHVIEVSEVLKLIDETPGKYLFIGVPCLVKAIRRLQLQYPILKESIPYTVGLVCGHLKSINWTLSLAWAKGVEPKDVSTFQYRTKGEGIPSRAYVFRATAIGDIPIIQEDSSNVIGGKFNAGALMLPGCDYCDDVVGETADLTIGDAWLPKYEVDEHGTNLLIVRNSTLLKVLTDAQQENRLHLSKITAEEATSSQSGGFRQRREGLSYRLSKAQKLGMWHPEKRIKANQFKLSKGRQKVYDSRTLVTKESREAFLQALRLGDYGHYALKMDVMIKKLRTIEIRSSFFRLCLNKASRIAHKFFSRLKN